MYCANFPKNLFRFLHIRAFVVSLTRFAERGIFLQLWSNTQFSFAMIVYRPTAGIGFIISRINGVSNNVIKYFRCSDSEINILHARDANWTSKVFDFYGMCISWQSPLLAIVDFYMNKIHGNHNKYHIQVSDVNQVIVLQPTTLINIWYMLMAIWWKLFEPLTCVKSTIYGVWTNCWLFSS